jgi:glyoxylase-like metal-dependent hydrolase (beta-lactamase superfamily II)
MTGAPVFVPSGEAAVATGDAKPVNPKGLSSGLLHTSMYKFIGHMISNKGLSKIKFSEVTPFGTDEVLEVPGKPRVVYTPGHSTAHSALLLEDRKILICGDAMATLDVGSGATGPMVHPFNQDRAQAIQSLDALEKVTADLLLPGHGEPWRGNVSEAVVKARREVV